jgi:hypothetical protein
MYDAWYRVSKLTLSQLTPQYLFEIRKQSALKATAESRREGNEGTMTVSKLTDGA